MTLLSLQGLNPQAYVALVTSQTALDVATVICALTATSAMWEKHHGFALKVRENE